MTRDEIFEALTRNAFDFLQRGISEFDKAPKFSVVHFCAAVEMLLKARLMKEHWSLVVSKPEQANLSKFMAGDFMSVTMDEARTRIRDVAGEDIADDAFSSFRALANHRNKMIHFFHSAVDGDGSARAQIVAEHCRSWFHLHQLLVRWDIYFSDFHAEIRAADRSMKKHRKYLRAKFKAVGSALNAAREGGNEPQRCSSCGFKAAVPDPFDPQIASVASLVCDHVETQVEMDCPRCDARAVIPGEGYATCPECSKAIEPDHLVSALTDDAATHHAVASGDDQFQPANCGECDGYQKVVNRGDRYFCAQCFGFSTLLEQCGWCSEMNTGDMEHSYFSGCGQCDGQAGHMRDD